MSAPSFIDLPSDVLAEILAVDFETHVPLKLTCRRTLEVSKQPHARPYPWVRAERGYVPSQEQHAAMRWALGCEARDQGGVITGGVSRGKTLVLLALLGAKSRRTLIVAPTPIMKVWRDELARAVPEKPLLIYAPNFGKRTPPAAKLRTHDLVLTSYTMVSAHSEDIAGAGFGRFVFDELHCVKSKTIEKLIFAQLELGRATTWAFASMPFGRPCKSIARISGQECGISGDNTYKFETAPYTEHITLVQPAPLHRQVLDLIATQLAQMPGIAGNMEFLNNPVMAEHITVQIQNPETGEVLDETQFNAHFQMTSVDRDEACRALFDLIVSAPPSDRFIVLAEREFVAACRGRLADHGGFLVATVRGSRAPHQDIERFRADPTLRALVLDYEVTEDFDLHFANRIVFLAPPVSVFVLDRGRAIGRVCRIGQRRPVTVHYIVQEGSVEERIIRAQNENHEA